MQGSREFFSDQIDVARTGALNNRISINMEKTETIPQLANSNRGKILIADDDKHFRDSLLKCLTRDGFDCEVAGSAAEAIELLRKSEFDVLLSDINMPGNFDLELVENMPAIADGCRSFSLRVSRRWSPRRVPCVCV